MKALPSASRASGHNEEIHRYKRPSVSGYFHSMSHIVQQRERYEALVLAAALVVGEAVGGDAPRVDRVFPPGGQRGTQVTVIADGRLDPWPVKVWTDAPGLAFRPLDATNQYEVTIAPTTPEGPHLVRFYSGEGASEPGLFVVGDFPELAQPPGGAEVEPRLDQFPLTYNGRVRNPAQLPSLLLALESSFVMQARLEAEGIDSPLRAGLALFDADGKQLATSDPSQGDPAISLRCAISQAGSYRLRLMRPGSGSLGEPGKGAEAAYRLSLTTERSFAPSVPETPGASSGGEIQRAYLAAQPVEMPSVVHGRIGHAGGERRYRFAARAQEEFYVRVRAVGALYPQVRIRDEAGNVIKTADPSLKGELTWVAPADGAYSLVVTDVQRRGGPDFGYELECGMPLPHWEVVADTHAVRVSPGERTSLTVRISRPRYDRGFLTLAVMGLPEDVVAAPGPVPEEGGAVRVELSAAAGAKPCNQPFQIVLMAVPSPMPHLALARAPIRGQFSAPGRLLINETDQIWLTVLERHK